MSVKYKIPALLLLLSFILILVRPSELKAEEKKFRFGAVTAGWSDTTISDDSLMSILANVLKFTYLRDKSTHHNRFYAIEDNDLKIAAKNITTDTLGGPYYYSHTHYNVWQAEGNQEYQEYAESLSLQHPAGIGTFVVDGGVTSYMVQKGTDSAALIQFGPYGYAQDAGFYGYGDLRKPDTCIVNNDTSMCPPYIDYETSYRVKVGTDYDPDSNEAVADLYVARVIYDAAGADSVVYTVAIDTLWDDDFPDTTNYIEKILTWNTQPLCSLLKICPTDGLDKWSKITRMELRVYWFGERDLYIDKVTVYDSVGKALIDGEKDANLYGHLHRYHAKSAALDAWCMRQEMHMVGDDVDCVKPWAYVESLLADSSEKGVGSMYDTLQTRFFLDLINPQLLFIGAYMLTGEYWSPGDTGWMHRYSTSYSSDYSGVDSINLQTKWDNFAELLDVFHSLSSEKGIDYIAILQGHAYRCEFTNPPCPCPPGWYYYYRPITNYELECEANLAVAHGAKGVLYFRYYTTASNCSTMGLYYENADDCEANDTTKWCWIKSKIGPYFDKLGETYYDLTWLGAGSSDEVGSIENSFIDSLRSQEYPDSAYVEVAFFDSADTDYFMLVNRRCLANESQNVTCYIDKQGKYRIIDLWEDDTAWLSTDQSPGLIQYATELNPGEGRLFKVIPFEGTVINVPGDLPSIQEAIDFALEGDTVLVDTGTYYENIDFKGKGILVASHYISNQDTSKISQTIIDGSQPENPDTASTVLFISFEDTGSVIKGFTVTGGTGMVNDPRFPNEKCGGGINCIDASTQILNNIIRQNQADNGYGGGIACTRGSPLIMGNRIIDNAALAGGGVSVSSHDYPKVIGNTIADDSALWGGGIMVAHGHPQVINNTLNANVSSYATEGAALDVGSQYAVVKNNIISDSPDGAGISCPYGGDPFVAFNNVWNNADGDFYGCGDILGDSTWGTNYNGTPCDSFSNIFRDPRYVDPDNGDFQLRDSSDCINAGDTLTCGDPDISRCHIDIGAHPFEYLCGDLNSDTNVDAADVVYFINWLFQGGPPPAVRVTAEVKCQPPIQMDDVIYLINYVYNSGPPPCQNCPS